MTGINNRVQRCTRYDHTKDGEPTQMETIHSLNDIERLATAQLDKRTWHFNYAAAGDLISKRLDQEVYRSILLRPRILANVKGCDLATTVIGNTVGIPFFVAPMAMARLAHPAGEAGISAACAGFGAMHIISNNASMAPEEITDGAGPGQIFGFQLYVQNDRSESEAVLARINKIPAIKCIVLTVDESVPGKHELGERGFEPYDEVHAGHPSPVQEVCTPSTAVGVALPSASGPASDLEWSDTLQWLARHTSLPVIIKGVQTHEDAQIASTYAPLVKGIILSNHGGRVLDTAPPAIHTLLEIRRYCPEVQQNLDIMVDGGIRRGTDVVKALCLGARAVGIGRPVLWGLGAGGVAGAERVLQILTEETRSCMQLLGVRRVADLGMHHINTSMVEAQIYNSCDN